MAKISEELLQGKTLRIYWYLLEHPISGIREIDRQLHFNSPSTVLYHINKLTEAGLIKKSDNDKYIATEIINQGIFSLYWKIGSRMVPRMVFYLSFLITILFCYLFIILRRSITTIYFEDIITLFILISAISFFAFEAYCVWNMKPN